MRRTALTWILTLVLLPALAGVGFAGSTAEESTSASATASTGMGGYSESPMLAAMVASGDLPPVDERLPAEPLVQDVVDRIGTYGGTFRGFQLGDADKWVLYKTGLYGGLISRSYLDLGTITPNGLEGWGPGIAKSWEWDDDAAGITVVLREGVKWSDGEPLGVHDIMFMWNEVQMNEGFQPTVPARYKVNGETMEVIQIDDHTIRFEFAGPNPWFLALLVLVGLLFFFDIPPPQGLFSPEYVDAPWSLGKLLDAGRGLILPVLVIGTEGLAKIVRITRANMLDGLQDEYVRTARAKGLAEPAVVLKHAFRVAVNPLISLFGMQFPLILSGEVVGSIVLGLPTLGPLLLDSLRSLDLYVSTTILMVLGILLLIGNLLADVLLALADPRIRFD